MHDFLDPLIDASFKGFPHLREPLRRSQIGQQGWNVLAGDLPLPLCVIKRRALEGNLTWMQGFAREHGVDMAPHGKTTMSPQLFRRQIEAGAWGITFATVTQARVGIAAGVQRCLIANQVFQPVDLEAVQSLLREHAGLRIVFLVDSLAQLERIEDWYGAGATGQDARRPFEVLLEIGLDGGRTGSRSDELAAALARRMRQSPAVRLVGIECYEGLWAKGNTDTDKAVADTLMARVQATARLCNAEQLFECDEVLMSAGGSAIFDLVASQLTPDLGRPVRGLLRSGCYVTHDDGAYKRMMSVMTTRLGCGHGLHAAMEVWAAVQSRPEPGLAILTVGRRDISFDSAMPVPLSIARLGERTPSDVPAGWSVTKLNDQHAYLCAPEGGKLELAVGDRVALGISHPCTTFDKWRWMPLVDDDYSVCDAIVTSF
ncbi:MAG: amino acid deaminase [Burkholderiaceae bacterium]